MTEISSSFKDQFKLRKTNEKENDFYSNKFNFLKAPTTYNVESVEPANMHPFNQFETLKKYDPKKFFQGNFRDNTIIINDYHSQEVGQYAKPKKEIKYMFEPMKNDNAMAGDTKIVDKIGLNRFNDSLHSKANDYPDNTYVRAEYIDGVPLTFTVRPREKTLEELRGQGVNSIRLDPNARNNMTGQQGEGVSTNPDTINITKFKMPSYREQNSVDDLLRTTGSITRPEWRSNVKQSNKIEYNGVEGPAVSSVFTQEYRNNQSARPTIKEETVVNNYISNPTSFVSTQEFRNNQSARPTIRNDYEENSNILNPISYIDAPEYRNNQSANPTIRDDYEQNTNIINPTSYIDAPQYRNNQSLNPTIRSEYEQNTNILNPMSYVDASQYRNNQLINPTNREEDYKYITAGYNQTAGYVYENNQEANPTNRENDYKYITAGYNQTAGYVYENNQIANPTNRDMNEKFMGSGFNQASGTYKNFIDKTRSGTVEEVLAKDYNGPHIAFVTKDESRLSSNNMVLNESIEASINLTKRDLMGGGVDRIPQGTNNIGEYFDWNRREKNGIITNRVRNVPVSYITEVPSTRGYELLQQRSAVNPYVAETLNNNPLVNNMDFKSTSVRDKIRENTFLSTREINRN